MQCEISLMYLEIYQKPTLSVHIHVLSYLPQYYIFSTGVAYIVVTIALKQISM